MVGARETKNGYAFRFYGDFNRFSNRPVSVIQAIDNSFFQSLIGRVFKIASKSYAFFAYSIYAFDYQVRRKVFNRPFLNMAVSSILQPFFEVEVNSSVLVG